MTVGKPEGHVERKGDYLAELDWLRERNEELLAAAEATVQVLREHVQYDNPDEGSAEQDCLNALEAAIAKARTP